VENQNQENEKKGKGVFSV